jgi:DNA polymerase III epsilon subunit family exonuclease
MSPTGDRIVELAAIRIDQDGSEREFHTLVNPGRSIPASVISVHHITDAMVVDAPHFSTVGKMFLDFAAGSTLAAHNARFDLGFLQESLARCGLPLWAGKTIDTVRLLRNTHPGLSSYRLQSLRTLFRLDSTDSMQAHRADSDVRWTVQVLEIALTKALNSSR